ncbi:hypothetical protein RSOL_361070 [Rhizoctonia solani AG-3 Rhs1AP]|uniref:MYND finger protein n=1 Tax=Rhizoctonia solani AG-3 Rhs1AP TaxID=1086054 RepID=X8JBR5_9AGAM|nr:hypothetical protein RSOL_361070 [Rhizoctonia solani AG-3 Rhs1AP]
MGGYEYLRKYARTDDTWQPSILPSTVGLARETIVAICARKDVSISMLQSVVSLTSHPLSLHLLGNPKLTQSCILRLSQGQQQDPSYPFGHEDGYLYFRVLVLATGVDLIIRNKLKYHQTINILLANERMEDLSVMLMEYVTGAVVELIYNKMVDVCDTFIGWKPGSLFDLKPVMSKADAAILLEVLYRDRKGFLRAWAETHAPSLSPLLFVLWRCAKQTRMPSRWISFCEIHWRYSIVAGTDHIGTLDEYNKDAGQYYEIWLPKGRPVDLEDARTILHAFTQRMQSTSILYPLPDVPTMGAMLSFVTPRSGLIPGVEDLFIPLVRVVFDYFWISVAGKSLHTKFRLEAEDVATVVHPAFVMVEHLVKHTPTRAKEFVKELINLGIIELLSRGFALIKREPGLDEQAKFSPLIRVCHEFSNSLLRVGPPTYRESEFADTFVEWFKTLRYLRSQDSMLNTRTDHTNWYEMSNRAWVEIGDILEYDVQVPRAEAMSRGCAYSRCPDPDSVRGVRFECPYDKVVVYCGPRCYQMDWSLQLPFSHRCTCACD